MFRTTLVLLLAAGGLTAASATGPTEVISLWPATPPGPAREVDEEENVSGPDSRLSGGRSVIRLTNISVPQAHVYLPPVEKRNGSVVVVCPGGAFNILAWDLEGTEVADWLTAQGVTTVVVKYRVPSRSVEPMWLLPVMDAQRAVSLVRDRADEWKLKKDRIGLLGFSAGGHTAVRTALAAERYYAPIDTVDDKSARPDMALLIYTAYLTNKGEHNLVDDLVVTADAPPMFMVHAFDDRFSVEGPLLLAARLKKANVPFEMHTYDRGGHGFGLRSNSEMPVASWPQRCEDWLRRNDWVQ